MRGNVPESLANRLGPMAMETGAAAPVAPSSDMRARLGTAPPPRNQPLDSRLGRSVDQNRVNSQTVSRRRRSDTPATVTPASTTGNRRAPCGRRELNQTVCCFGTVQIPAVGDNVRRTCRRS